MSENPILFDMLEKYLLPIYSVKIKEYMLFETSENLWIFSVNITFTFKNFQ